MPNLPRCSVIIVPLWSVLCSLGACAQEVRVHDPRLSLQLFAEDPQIVTPIGLAVGPDDGVYVIESHTHLAPQDYEGPDSDRIKVFHDRDNDGIPERTMVFADGLQEAMNLAFGPSGDLYVVCSRSVIRLRDTDGDGSVDRQDQILRLETSERYAHNSLLSITIAPGGEIYIGRGNTGSRFYRAVGSDGSHVEGYGDGGSVLVCNADGTSVREYATGFWNPFDLKFDLDGRLLLVDNDPDARGPNRLIWVLEEGDYGYQSIFGGGGNHPFQGWDGTLAGTLPYLAGTGEAPSGVIDLRRSSFPADYRRSVLATIWNENSIERFSFENGLDTPTKSIFMSGPKDFRPVALDCDSKGNLYLSDWVLVDYPNHGRGKIWRITTNKTSDDRLTPCPAMSRLSDKVPQEKALPIEKLYGATGATAKIDPYMRHMAVHALAKSNDVGRIKLLQRSTNPELRLAALQAASMAKRIDRSILITALQDSDINVRTAALRYASRQPGTVPADELNSVLQAGEVTPQLFECWLAATECSQPAFISALTQRTEDKSNAIERVIDREQLLAWIQESQWPARVSALAVSYLDRSVLDSEIVESLLSRDSTEIQLAVLHSSAIDESLLSDLAIRDRLQGIANDQDATSELRSAALERLCDAETEVSGERLDFISEFLVNENEELALTVAKRLRAQVERPGVRRTLEMVMQQVDAGVEVLRPSVQEQISYALYGSDSRRNPFVERQPSSLEAWRSSLLTGGRASRGRSVFMEKRVGCSQCHSIDGRSTLLGPDLSKVAQSKSRQQIIDAILEPSADFPPQYQAWLVVTEDGQIVKGLQLDHKQGGAIVMTTTEAKNRRFESDEILDYRASPKSLMPDGLQETMSLSEFRDLVAFLMTMN